MQLAQLKMLDTDFEHACVLNGEIIHIPNKEDGSETDSNGVSIEQDLIDVDDWMLDGLPNTNYTPLGVEYQYGL